MSSQQRTARGCHFAPLFFPAWARYAAQPARRQQILFPGAAQHEVMRCRTGIVAHSALISDDPGSAVHRCALHRVRETRILF
jgi:hypothetical protein